MKICTITNLLIGLVSCFIVKTATAQTCGTAPTCESLGYTKTASFCSKGGVAIKCPFDTSKVFCADQHCNVGDFFYTDYTCSPTKTGDNIAGIYLRQGVLLYPSPSWGPNKWDEARWKCYGARANYPLPDTFNSLPSREEAILIAFGKTAINSAFRKMGLPALGNDWVWTITDENHNKSNNWDAYYVNLIDTANGYNNKDTRRYFYCVTYY